MFIANFVAGTFHISTNMNLLIAILFMLAIVACTYLFLRFMVAKLPRSFAKYLLFTTTVAGSLMCLALLVAAACVPMMVNDFLDKGIEKVKAHASNISPDFVYEEQEVASIRAFLADDGQIKAGLESAEDGFWVVRNIGLDTYMESLNDFSAHLENNIQIMNEQQDSPTIDNILNKVKQKSQPGIRKATRTIEIIILVATLLMFVALVTAFFKQHRKAKQKAREAAMREEEPTPAEPVGQ